MTEKATKSDPPEAPYDPFGAQAMRLLREERDRIVTALTSEPAQGRDPVWREHMDRLIAIEQVLAMRELGSAVVLGGGMGLVGGLLGSSRPRTFAERLADLLSDVGPIAKAKPE